MHPLTLSFFIFIILLCFVCYEVHKFISTLQYDAENDNANKKEIVGQPIADGEYRLSEHSDAGSEVVNEAPEVNEPDEIHAPQSEGEHHEEIRFLFPGTGREGDPTKIYYII